MTFNELSQLIVKDIIHYYFEENISESHVEPLKTEQKECQIFNNFYLCASQRTPIGIQSTNLSALRFAQLVPWTVTVLLGLEQCMILNCLTSQFFLSRL